MSYTWRRPVVNGGFCNVVAADPNHEGVFYAIGDMYGPHRSEDAGRTWIPTAHGGSGIGDTYGRAVLASKTTPGTAYCGVATLKTGGGKFAVCSGYTIEYRSTAVGFGLALGSGAGAVLPRPVGSMLDSIMNGASEVIWAASSKGLAYSTDQGHTWHVLANTVAQYRAVVALTATSALAARWNASGLTLANGSTVTHPAAPGQINDLRRIGSAIYAVGPGGVYTWTGSGLTKIASSGFFAGTIPTSIDGEGNMLVVGTGTPGQKCAAISADAGKTWTWLGGREKQILLDGRPYWQSGATNGFAGSHYSVSQVAVDKQNPLNVMFAGRSGIWGSQDGCKTIYPLGPGGSEDFTVKVGPGASEFSCNDNDWTCLHTSDGWQTMDRRTTAPGGNSGLSTSVGGHTYQVTAGRSPDVKRDGVSIADEVFRASGCYACCVGANAAGVVTVGLYGGGVVVGHP